MANVSDVNGYYEFDFSNTKVSVEDRIGWLKRLSNLLATTDYDTSFETIENPSGDHITLSFFGSGRWTYESNLAWFAQGWDELTALMQEMDGIKITVYYKEYETGCWFVAEGDYEIEVNGKEVIVTQNDLMSDELTKDNFVDMGFGTEADYDEMFGDE